MQERPEDALRRVAGECIRLQEKLGKYTEAIALWDALTIGENDQIVHAVLIAKMHNFETGNTDISTSATDGCDWVDQIGLFGAWQVMNLQNPILPKEDDGP